MKYIHTRSFIINLRLAFKLLILFYFLFFSYNAFSVKGVLTDNYGKLVPFATIRFVDQANPSNVFMGTSDAYGNYSVDAPLINWEDNAKHFIMFEAYPNPSSNGVVIPFHLANSGNLMVSIYNTYGERVNTIAEGSYTSGLYQMIWDGKTNANQRVSTGIYFVQIVFNGRTSCKKVVLYNNNGNTVSPIPIDDLLSKLKPYKIKYTITVTGSTIDPYYLTDYEIMKPDSNNFIVNRHVPIPYKSDKGSNFLSVYNINTNTYSKIFIKGINLGVGLPGTYPGELAADSMQYVSWFNKMVSAGFNVIRTYTIHFPRFYNALAKFNEDHQNTPLYLLQGIWLDEDTIYKSSNNFYKYATGFDNDIKEALDCVHGRKIISPRPGKSYGNFNIDISRWILGYVVGREVSPYEVWATDSANVSHVSYNGQLNAITLPANGTPMECWIAERLDNLIRYERKTYYHERPVSFTSWPTLDPLQHITESFNYGSLEDTTSIDLRKLVMKNAPAGFFLSYHAYPYYPDFITATPGYSQISDSIGPCPYYGYLLSLKSIYSYPLIIAEFGVPSSWGNAHFEYNGMNQGGEDEIEQGNYDVRMIKAIYQAGCGGGCLFSWINENFKNSWITEPTSCGIDRRILWHNQASPEQNFGLLKYVEDPPTYNHWTSITPTNPARISKIEADYDNAFFYTKIHFDTFNSDDTLYVGFDTYGDGVGEGFITPSHSTNNLCEFMLKITRDSANLYVTQAYDTYGIWKKFDLEDTAQQVFHSISTAGFPWKIVRWKNNNPANSTFYFGRLRNCNSINVPSSNNAVTRYTDHVEIRLPWHILNFTDPSNLEVLDCTTCTGGKRPHAPPISMFDNTSTPKETTVTTGIALSVIMGNPNSILEDIVETNRFVWDPWGIDIGTGVYTPPSPLKEVEKQSLQIIKTCFQTTTFQTY